MRFMAEPLKRRRNASSLGRARSSSSGGADTPATDTAPNAGDHVMPRRHHHHLRLRRHLCLCLEG